jgi:hypothetical protein
MSVNAPEMTDHDAWIAHVSKTLAFHGAHDERVKRNAQIARGMSVRKAVHCCEDEPYIGRSARFLVPVAVVGDKSPVLLFRPEPVQFTYWRADSQYTPIVEILESHDIHLAKLPPMPLEKLDYVFGPASEIVVLPKRIKFDGLLDAGPLLDSTRCFVAHHIWQLCGQEHAVRLSFLLEDEIATSRSKAFGESSFLRERLVPYWPQSDFPPLWARVHVHELSSKELAQLQI